MRANKKNAVALPGANHDLPPLEFPRFRVKMGIGTLHPNMEPVTQ